MAVQSRLELRTQSYYCTKQQKLNYGLQFFVPLSIQNVIGIYVCFVVAARGERSESNTFAKLCLYTFDTSYEVFFATWVFPEFISSTAKANI